MANWMSAFRKRQKVVLAVLGIVCMFGFVIGPTVLQVMGNSRRGAQDPVVVTTKYGKLHQSDLQAMKQSRAVANHFIDALAEVVIGRQVEQKFFGPDTEESVVNTMLMARRAEDLGVVLSNAAINEFLKQLTQDRVTHDQFVSLLKKQRVSDTELYDDLRRELLSRRFQEMAFSGMMDFPPAERWEFYQRLHREAKVELVAVPVADFIDQVPDPSAAVLATFFDEHKEKLPDPASPEPGFKVPMKVAFQHLRADFEKFQSAVEVTDEEIAAYYQKNKERYKRLALPGDGTDTSGTETSGTSQPDSGAPIGGTTPEPMPPAGAATPEGEEAPVGETPATDEGTLPQREDLPPPDGASVVRPGAVVAALALALFDENPENATQAAPPEDLPADGDAAPDSDPSATPASQEGPATEEGDSPDTPPADSQPPASEPTPSDPAPTEPTGTTDSPAAAETPAAAEAPAEETPAPTEAPPEAPIQPATTPAKPAYKPLEEVREEIRRELTRDRAAEQIATLLKGVRERLDRYSSDRRLWEAGSGPEPERPDFAALAEEHGLTAHETELESASELASQTEFGKSRIQAGDLVSKQAYGPTLALFKVAVARDDDGNQYLFWKTAQQEERVPDLADPATHAEVVRAWKLIEARALARRRADKLAEQAGDRSLSEALAGQEGVQVVETEPFTWMTEPTFTMFGSMPSQLNQVPGVDHPGHDFMRTVFALETGKTGVALNQPQTIAYVIRLLETKPSLAFLRLQFFGSRFEQYSDAANPDLNDFVERWIKEVQTDANLHWERPPDRLASRTGQ